MSRPSASRFETVCTPSPRPVQPAWLCITTGFAFVQHNTMLHLQLGSWWQVARASRSVLLRRDISFFAEHEEQRIWGRSIAVPSIGLPSEAVYSHRAKSGHRATLFGAQ